MKKILLVIGMLFLFILGGCGQDETESSEGNKEKEEVNFPERKIDIIVPYDGGGESSLRTRLLGDALSENLPGNYPATVVNMPGGGSIVGLSEVYNEDPDGYTLGSAASGAFSVIPLFGESPYKHDDFDYLAGFSSEPFMLYVNADSELETFDQWIDYVKDNPGEFKLGTSAVGNLTHIGAEEIDAALDIETKIVPMNGGEEIFTGVMGGHIDGFIDAYGPSKSRVEEGSLRILANLSAEDVEGLEDVQKVQDYGDNDIDVGNISVIAAPKDMPDDVFKVLVDGFKNVIEDPEIQKEFENLDTTLEYFSPDELAKTFSDQAQHYEKILKDIDLID